MPAIDASSWFGSSAPSATTAPSAAATEPQSASTGLREMLLDSAPAGLVTVLPVSSGDAAIKACVTLARHHCDVVVTVGSTIERTGADHHVEAPWCYRCPDGVTPHDAEAETLGALAAIMAERRAAVVIEPSFISPGARPVPPGFVQKVRALCDEHLSLLIADETRVGAGRTGFLWGCTRDGVTPDLLAGGEGLTAGTAAFGVVLTTGATQGVPNTAPAPDDACAAAAAHLSLLLADGFLGEVRRKAAILADLVGDLAGHPMVGSVRVRGFAAAIELVGDKALKFPPSPDAAALLVELARRDGIELSAEGDVIVITPSLFASDEDVKAIVKAIGNALASSLSALGRD